MVRRYIMNWIKCKQMIIIDSWVAAIKNDTVPEVNGKDALDAMKAIFAALESSESGQTVEITEED